MPEPSKSSSGASLGETGFRDPSLKPSGHKDFGNYLLIAMVVGMVGGGLAGWFLGTEADAWFGWIGDFFLTCLKMLVVPLVLFSMMSGVATLGDVRRLGRTGGATVLYYLATTALAVALGILLVNLIEPGRGFERETLSVTAQAKVDTLSQKEGSLGQALQDMALTLVHPNLVGAMVESQMLPLIVFSLVFGGILTTLGERGRRALEIIDTLNDAVLIFVRLIIWMAPIGIFGLVASKLGATGGGEAFWGEIHKVGKYSLTVILGLLFHGLITLPLIALLLGRRNPYVYLFQLSKALTTAFSTGSSAATLPVTMECVEDNGRVDRRSSRFVLPLGATVNMDGTALYEAVAVIFIAQSYGTDLTSVQQFIIFLTASLAAIGAAAIPEAGLVTMVLVLQAVGLPLEGIGLILGIDWFLDRCRTAINVWGDAVGASVIERHALPSTPAPPVPTPPS